MTLVLDGERAVPELMEGTPFTRLLMWEHLERYKLAQGHGTGRRILDVACGAGYGTAMLSQGTSEEVVGADLSTDALAHAEASYGGPRIRWHEMDLENQESFAGFDMVVSMETIEHLEHPAAFVERVYRDLPHGGLLCLSTPVVPFSRFDRFHRRVFTQEQLRQLVRNAGFEIIEELTTSFRCLPWQVLLTKLYQSPESRKTWALPVWELLRILTVGLYWEDTMLVCEAVKRDDVDVDERRAASEARPPQSTRLGRVLGSFFRGERAERLTLRAPLPWKAPTRGRAGGDG